MADPVTTKTTSTPRGCTACGTSNAPSARFCAACGAGLPPLIPAGTAPGSVAALLDDARHHLLLGHWEDAGLAAEAVLTLDPNSAEGHHIAARARLKQSMNASALVHAERAVELDPANGEYQATLAEALRATEGDGPRLSVPTLAASIVAFLVLAFIVILATVNRKPETTRAAVPAPSATTPASPFAQPPGNAAFPQPRRPANVDANRPRIPARSAPLDTGSRGTATQQPGSALLPNTPRTAMAPTTPTNPLAPAPVDSTPLRRFAEPVSPFPAAPAQPGATSRPPNTQPPTPPGVVAPPPPQPGGGTIFGPSPAGTPGSTNAETNTTPFSAGPADQNPAPTAVAARPSPPASPQQNFMQRNYGGAIQGLQQRIAAGQATGSNYQQLGAAYANVGDTGQAAAAYQNAIAAYRAQIQAGENVDVATRGLRTTQMQLNRLQTR